MPKLSNPTTNGEQRRERLAANIADLTRLDNSIRGILLSGKLAENHVITDKGRADEAAVELTCPLLTAATTLDIIREHDRRLRQHPTRVYLRRAVAWNKLPGDAVLSVVERDSVCNDCSGNTGYWDRPNGERYLSDPDDGTEWQKCDACDGTGRSSTVKLNPAIFPNEAEPPVPVKRPAPPRSVKTLV